MSQVAPKFNDGCPPKKGKYGHRHTHGGEGHGRQRRRLEPRDARSPRAPRIDGPPRPPEGAALPTL